MSKSEKRCHASNVPTLVIPINSLSVQWLHLISLVARQVEAFKRGRTDSVVQNDDHVLERDKDHLVETDDSGSPYLIEMKSQGLF